MVRCVHDVSMYIMIHTQWFRRKGQYFGSKSASHCKKKKVHMNTRLIVNGCWDTAVSIYKYKINVNLLTVNLILILICFNAKFVILHDECFKILSTSSVHFKTCVWRVRADFWVDLHISSCKQQHPICDQFVLCIHLLLANLALYPIPQTKIWWS
jgi:hypothetical protein